jgi:hypothetical protein
MRRACFICGRGLASEKLPIGAVTCWACNGIDALADRQLVREGILCPSFEQVRGRARQIRMQQHEERRRYP